MEEGLEKLFSDMENRFVGKVGELVLVAFHYILNHHPDSEFMYNHTFYRVGVLAEENLQKDKTGLFDSGVGIPTRRYFWLDTMSGQSGEKQGPMKEYHDIPFSVPISGFVGRKGIPEATIFVGDKEVSNALPVSSEGLLLWGFAKLLIRTEASTLTLPVPKKLYAVYGEEAMEIDAQRKWLLRRATYLSQEIATAHTAQMYGDKYSPDGQKIEDPVAAIERISRERDILLDKEDKLRRRPELAVL